MTDQELRAAADKIATWHELTAVGCMPSAYAPDDQQVIAVCRRLLDLLPPADDGEAVTAEWLRLVGFKEDGPYGWESVACGDGLLMIDWCEGYHDGRPILWAHPELGCPDDCDDVTRELQLPGLLTTRGHVRRLAAAIGITLTEPKS